MANRNTDRGGSGTTDRLANDVGSALGYLIAFGLLVQSAALTVCRRPNVSFRTSEIWKIAEIREEFSDGKR